MVNTVFIYSLACPITGFVKYIGKTFDPRMRLRKHLTAKKKAASSLWIFSLKQRGLLPIFEILIEVPSDNWENTEREYILLFKSFGAPLLNHTIGGEGGNTMGGRKLTLEQANKISLSKKGKSNPSTAIYNKLCKGRKIDQFDLNGRLIATHLSIRDAARAINKCDRRIQCMVKGLKIKGSNINHVGGFVFKYAA